MLNPEFKKKWVEALRSGHFKQGKGSMHWAHKNTYCCLGVLCKINNLNISYEVVRNRIGLTEDQIQKCIDLNDNRNDRLGNEIGNKSFEFIADFIEENY